MNMEKPKRSWIEAHADGTPQEAEFEFLKKQWDDAFDVVAESASDDRFNEINELTQNTEDSQVLERYLTEHDQELTTEEKNFIRASISLKNFRAEHNI